MKKLIASIILGLCSLYSYGQEINWKGQKFVPHYVTASLIKLNGEQVLKVERDLKAFPFDMKNLIATVDEPTYVKLKGVDLENGIIEVKTLSRVQDPAPFDGAQGFIGLAFRINDNDSAYESIYLRPKAGRSESQRTRNHTVQYYAYPDYKFDKLAQEKDAAYETYADIDLNEWINVRIEVTGGKAVMYLNDQKAPAFIVDKMKGKTTHGEVALWVDVATTGYFKDLKITKR